MPSCAFTCSVSSTITSARASRSTSSAGPERAQEGLVGPEFFELVGAPTLIGRTFTSEEFARAERVVVLSETLWQRVARVCFRQRRWSLLRRLRSFSSEIVFTKTPAARPGVKMPTPNELRT
jgi:hypothetical protein